MKKLNFLGMVGFLFLLGDFSIEAASPAQLLLERHVSNVNPILALDLAVEPQSVQSNEEEGAMVAQRRQMRRRIEAERLQLEAERLRRWKAERLRRLRQIETEEPPYTRQWIVEEEEEQPEAGMMVVQPGYF